MLPATLTELRCFCSPTTVRQGLLRAASAATRSIYNGKRTGRARWNVGRGCLKKNGDEVGKQGAYIYGCGDEPPSLAWFDSASGIDSHEKASITRKSGRACTVTSTPSLTWSVATRQKGRPPSARISILCRAWCDAACLGGGFEQARAASWSTHGRRANAYKTFCCRTLHYWQSHPTAANRETHF